MIYVRVDTPDTKPLSTVLRHVAPLVPEVPYEMALDMLRQSFIEFARRTGLLISHYTPPLQRGVKSYPLEPPEGYEIYAVSSVYNGNMYRPYNDAHHWNIGWGTRFNIRGNNWIDFADAPSQDYVGDSIALHLLPTEYTQDIPDEVAVPFGKGIAMGAAADMLEIPNQPWYNPNLASVKRREFYRTVLSGKNLRLTNRGANTLTFKHIRVI